MFIHKTRNILDLNSFNEAVKVHNSKIEVVLKFGFDDLRFQLSEALTSQEDSDLGNFVNEFADSDPELKVPKIYDYARPHVKSKDHRSIIYTSTKDLTQSLHPKRVAVKGEVQYVEWYSDIDETMTKLSNLILKVQITYTRLPSGLALYRDTIRTWINRDGTENTQQASSRKYYTINSGSTIDEGIKRRTLLVTNIQVPVMEAMKQVLMPYNYTEEAVILKGRDFLDDYHSDFEMFKKESSSENDPSSPDYLMKKVVIRLRDEQNPDYLIWLDEAPAIFGGQTTIRQYLINEFDI